MSVSAYEMCERVSRIHPSRPTPPPTPSDPRPNRLPDAHAGHRRVAVKAGGGVGVRLSGTAMEGTESVMRSAPGCSGVCAIP